MLHLLLLFALRKFFIDAVLVSVPLIVLRVPQMRTWWARCRRMNVRRVARVVIALVLVSTFAAGYVPFVRELARAGTMAFHQDPVDD
jgi:hypothetical protein